MICVRFREKRASEVGICLRYLAVGRSDTVELAVDADASLPSRLVIYGISGLLSRNLRVDIYWTGTENR